MTRTSKAQKQISKLPESARSALFDLIKELEERGPVRTNWKNYSKLGGAKHHCHIKDGRPSYVVCWEVIDKTVRIVEIYYAGTREKAPY